MKLDLELPSLSRLMTSCSLYFVFTIININYVLQMSAEMLKEHVDNLSELRLHTWTVHHQSIFTAIRQLSSGMHKYYDFLQQQPVRSVENNFSLVDIPAVGHVQSGYLDLNNELKNSDPYMSFRSSCHAR